MPNIHSAAAGRGRPKTDPFWIDRVRSLTANEQLGGKAIAKRLEQEQRALGRNDAPQERTVFRIQEDFRKLPDWQQGAYQAFTWPESMEIGAVPYEASAAALELLAFARQNRPLETDGTSALWDRPQIRLVLWYWRVTQAAPDLPAATKARIAGSLVARDVLGTGIHPGEIEWRLAFAPWRSAAALQAYVEAVDASGKDDPDPVRWTVGGEPNEWNGGIEFASDVSNLSSEALITAMQSGLGLSHSFASLAAEGVRFAASRIEIRGAHK